MDKGLIVLQKLLGNGQYITTKKLDEILLEVWGNKYDAGMHCNSLMRRGWIDYIGDGDWILNYIEEDIKEE